MTDGKNTAKGAKRAPDGDSPPVHFIRQIIADDILSNTWEGRVVTRFPPEPNGYLHIGHAKAVCLNFGLAAENENGVCHMRFDDTNPSREESEYVEAIKKDVRWLGFDWGAHLYFASDYFEQLYKFAVLLIKRDKAYVDDLSAEDIRRFRGTLTEAGEESPFRARTVEENLDLFRRMKSGEFGDGERVLRAKIDMASPNLNMRDPVMYRILHRRHHRTGNDWCVYPMYDFAHGQSDSIERVTHSICTLEFEDHRPLYNWYLDTLEIYHPRQYEFARLNLSYTVLSKRNLLRLVEEGFVSGWNDPRMPTLSGMRRRGFTSAAIREFCERIGVAKRDNVIDIALLEHCLRDDLNKSANRAMAVLDPLKVVIENYPDGEVDELDAVNNPEDPSAGSRKVPFSRVLWIERNDFLEEAPRKFFRLAPGREVRLRYGYFITCVGVVKDAQSGEVTELRCTYDPATRGGQSPDGRKVRGTIHWVSAAHAFEAEVRLYDRLFNVEHPDAASSGKDFTEFLNPDSVEVKRGFLEPGLAEARTGETFQFERVGYFCVDNVDSQQGCPIFNRVVPLRDSWGRMQKRS